MLSEGIESSVREEKCRCLARGGEEQGSGLVQRAEDWPRSSVHDYSGSLSAAPIPNRTLTIDRILLPADEQTRI
jgi:hypothetical protein